MAKLILSLDHAVLNEYPLDQERLTIGRRPTNDVQIDNLAVSGQHAAIIKLGNDFYLEDLNSTNGTFVNATPVKKHLLQHDDVVEFGKYQLKYIDTSVSNKGNMASDVEKDMVIRPSAMRSREQRSQEVPLSMPKGPTASTPKADVSAVAASPAAAPSASPSTQATSSADTESMMRQDASSPGNKIGEGIGKIQVLNGSSTGRELILNKALTTLGKPGVQVAVITKRPNGYFITHVEGKVRPIVNGASTGAQAFALNDHDVIELAGVKMAFYLN